MLFEGFEQDSKDKIVPVRLWQLCIHCGKRIVNEENIMSENKNNDNKRLGLTPPEFDNLMDMLRYGITIVVVVAITFVIVALISKMLGY